MNQTNLLRVKRSVEYHLNCSKRPIIPGKEQFSDHNFRCKHWVDTDYVQALFFPDATATEASGPH